MIENFLDIGLLLVITGFIILKLYNVLGHDSTTNKLQDQNQVDLQNVTPSNNVISLFKALDVTSISKKTLPPYLRAVLAKINGYDASFSEVFFMRAAKQVFEMIFTAYEKSDTQILQALVSDEVYKELVEDLAMKATDPKTTERELVMITTAEIIDAKLAGTQATIKVKFCSLQKNKTHQSIQNTIPDLSKNVNIEDIWIFSRDVSSADPKWLLTAINC